MDARSSSAAWTRGEPATRLARGPSRLLDSAPDADEPAGAHVRWALELAASDLLCARLASETGWRPENVHRARVAVRRLRAHLIMFLPVLRPEIAEPVRTQLLAVGAGLAPIRKIDAVVGAISRSVEERLEVDARGVGAVVRLLDERDQFVAAGRRVIAGQADLWNDLANGLLAAAVDDREGSDACEPGWAVLPGLVRQRWRFFRDAARELPDLPNHEIGVDRLRPMKVRSRRLRYAAESAAGALGEPVLDLAAAATSLHEALGDLNDAVGVIDWLEGPDAADLPIALRQDVIETVARDQEYAVLAWPVAVKRVLAAKSVTRTPRAARPIAAAGGIVWRLEHDRIEVVVVHRVRHDDWSLPKGCTDVGESAQACARREVAEETGLQCELGAELVSTQYRNQDSRPKVVRWWAMTPASGQLTISPEVDELAWLPTAEARLRLTKGRERRVLDALMEFLATGVVSEGPKGLRAAS